MIARTGPRDDTGFSLIEMIVSLALVSLIAVALADVGHGSIQVFKHGQSLMARDTAVASARRKLSDILMGQRLHDLEFEADDRGGSRVIRWRAPLTMHTNSCEQSEYSLEITDPGTNTLQNGGNSILFKWRCLGGGRPGGPETIGQNLPPILFSLTPRRDAGAIEPKLMSNIMGIWVLGCPSTPALDQECGWPDYFIPVLSGP